MMGVFIHLPWVGFLFYPKSIVMNRFKRVFLIILKKNPKIWGFIDEVIAYTIFMASIIFLAPTFPIILALCFSTVLGEILSS
jgi:hypothetical protein